LGKESYTQNCIPQARESSNTADKAILGLLHNSYHSSSGEAENRDSAGALRCLSGAFPPPQGWRAERPPGPEER